VVSQRSSIVLTTETRTVNRGAILAVLLTGQFMANIDTAVANVAGPSIGADLHASEGAVGLVVSGYVVAFAVLLITGARLGSSLGYRRTFLLGLTVFTVASALCGLAPGIATLVVARFVQGAGAALMVPQVLSGIQLHFQGRDRLKALGYFSIALSGGAVAGQLLGGVLIAADIFGTGWRPIFLVNVPIGIALAVAGRRLLPADSVARRDRLDLAGVLALSTTVLLVIVPLLLGSERGWPTWSWLCLLLSLPALALFEYGERRTAARGGRPLVARQVLADRSVRAGLLAHGCTSGTYFALLFVLALYLQGGLHKGPAYSGLRHGGLGRCVRSGRTDPAAAAQGSALDASGRLPGSDCRLRVCAGLPIPGRPHRSAPVRSAGNWRAGARYQRQHPHRGGYVAHVRGVRR